MPHIPEDYITTNKTLWNNKTNVHFDSSFYNVKEFKKGQQSLNSIELGLLGNVTDKSVLHLQCHFGMDTLSLARMGASATGIDLSDKAIEKANELKNELALNAEFICCNVYDTLQHITKKYDIVFTSYGTIGWLPDLTKWAHVVAHSLKPGGLFVMADFHPALWMFDDDFTYVQYPYFNYETIIENTSGTYAERDAPIKNTSVSWNHSASELINSLIGNGLEIKSYNEYDYSPYNCFKNMEEVESNKFRIKTMGNKLPMVYAIRALKKA